MAQRNSSLGARRKALGYTQEHFAEALGVARSTVWRWENGEVVPQPTQRFTLAQLLQVSLDGLDELLAACADSGDAIRPDCDPRRTALVECWDRPSTVRRDIEVLRGTNIGVVEVEQYEQHVAQLVADYERQGPAELGRAAARMRQRAHEALRGQQPLRLRYRLYRVTAQLAGLLGYMAVNTGQFTLANAYCAEASELAEEIDDLDLRMWVCGTLALSAYYAGDYATSYCHAVQGRSLAPDHPQSIRLLANGEARALGQLGDRQGADAAIGRALDLVERHDIPSVLLPCLSFAPYGYARVAANAATTYVPLGDTTRVVYFGGTVDQAVEQADSDWSRALVRLDVAAAVLRQAEPDLDQAVTLGREALNVCTTRPIRSVWQRARELAELTRHWPHDRRTREYDEVYRAWAATTGVRAITTASARATS